MDEAAAGVATLVGLDIRTGLAMGRPAMVVAGTAATTGGVGERPSHRAAAIAITSTMRATAAAAGTTGGRAGAIKAEVRRSSLHFCEQQTPRTKNYFASFRAFEVVLQ